MKLVKSSTFTNTPAIKGITYGRILAYLFVFVVAIIILQTPLGQWNWPIILAIFIAGYFLVGVTPTGRSMLTNIYGILWKKPLKMVVSEQATDSTIGHGIREVRFQEDLDVPTFRMTTGLLALVYTVTSSINQWSTEEERYQQHARLEGLFEMFEGGERLDLVVKQDSDTDMLRIADALLADEHFQGDDLARLSARRQGFLHQAATTPQGRSVQQYAVLQVKPSNISRSIESLKGTSRMQPASHPLDVLLAAMGLEGGLTANESIQEKE